MTLLKFVEHINESKIHQLQSCQCHFHRRNQSCALSLNIKWNFRPVKTGKAGGRGEGGGGLIFAKVDLLLIENDSEKKNVAT